MARHRWLAGAYLKFRGPAGYRAHRRLYWKADLIDDVVEEAFLRLWLHFGKDGAVKSEEELWGRLCKELSNAISRVKRKPNPLPLQYEEGIEDTEMGPEAAAEYEELHLALRRAVDCLDRDQRQVIRQYFLRKRTRTLQEIAKATGRSISWVHKRKEEGVAQLREDSVLSAYRGRSNQGMSQDEPMTDHDGEANHGMSQNHGMGDDYGRNHGMSPEEPGEPVQDTEQRAISALKSLVTDALGLLQSAHDGRRNGRAPIPDHDAAKGKDAGGQRAKPSLWQRLLSVPSRIWRSLVPRGTRHG